MINNNWHFPGGWNTWNAGGYGASSSSGSNAGVFWGNSGTVQSGQQGGQASQEVDWSSSATSSDDGQEYVEVPDIGHLEPNVAAEHVYLMYRKRKRMWRRYTGRPTRTFRRHFRFYKRRVNGYGKGKGFLADQVQPSDLDLQNAFLSGKGKGHRQLSSGKGFGRRLNPR